MPKLSHVVRERLTSRLTILHNAILHLNHNKIWLSLDDSCSQFSCMSNWDGEEAYFCFATQKKTGIEQLKSGWVYTQAAPSPNLTCQLHLQVTLAWNPSIYPQACVHPSVYPATHQSWIGSISFKPFHPPFTTDNSFCVCRGAALSITRLWNYCARASSFLVSKWHQLTDTLSESCHRSWGASFRHVRPLGIGIGFPQTPLSKD